MLIYRNMSGLNDANRRISGAKLYDSTTLTIESITGIYPYHKTSFDMDTAITLTIDDADFEDLVPEINVADWITIEGLSIEVLLSDSFFMKSIIFRFKDSRAPRVAYAMLNAKHDMIEFGHIKFYNKKTSKVHRFTCLFMY